MKKVSEIKGLPGPVWKNHQKSVNANQMGPQPTLLQTGQGKGCWGNRKSNLLNLLRNQSWFGLVISNDHAVSNRGQFSKSWAGSQKKGISGRVKGELNELCKANILQELCSGTVGGSADKGLEELLRDNWSCKDFGGTTEEVFSIVIFGLLRHTQRCWNLLQVQCSA